MVYRAGVLMACGLLQACMGTTFGTQSAPANFPPASFTGAQYVDNDGCAYIRAGSGDVVTWGPRLNPDRSQVCGLAPTFGATQDQMEVVSTERMPATDAAYVVSASARAVSGLGWLFGSQTVPASNADPAKLVGEVIRPPAGYVRVWTDGRVNPQRGFRRVSK